MKRWIKIAAGILACVCVLTLSSSNVAAATNTDILQGPTVQAPLQPVGIYYDPSKIILPYGAVVSALGDGSYAIVFLDGDSAILSPKARKAAFWDGDSVELNSAGICYTKTANGVPVNVQYDPITKISIATSANTTAYYKNGSFLTSKVVMTPFATSIESYSDDGTIVKNTVYDPGMTRIIAVDDYKARDGMIIRTSYDELGRVSGITSYYGSTVQIK